MTYQFFKSKNLPCSEFELRDKIAAWLRDSPGMYANLSHLYQSAGYQPTVLPVAVFRLDDDLLMISKSILHTALDECANYVHEFRLLRYSRSTPTFHRIAVRKPKGSSVYYEFCIEFNP